MEIVLAFVLGWLFFGGCGVAFLWHMIKEAGNKIITKDWLFFSIIFFLGLLGLLMAVFAVIEITTNNERGW